MSTVWFTSDVHYGHKAVAKLRGFEDTIEDGGDFDSVVPVSAVDHHNDELEEHWRSTVKKDDRVWVLGDAIMGNLQAGLDWFNSLPGTKHLVAGNHDGCHPMHDDSHSQQRRYLEAFDSVQESACRKMDGRRVLMSHFPYDTYPEADHTPGVRYRQWRKHDQGLFLLHGHTHLEHQRRHGPMLHVGVDAWGMQLVSREQVVDELRAWVVESA